MNRFDVLYDPWIPVVTVGGESQTLGILPALEQAHTLRDVLCESPLETYAVFRLLIAFLMDAYSPASVNDRVSIYRSGRFDPVVLSQYVSLCLTEEASFDLFDEKRPFMQAAFDPELDIGKEKSAANLFHALPTGTYHVHFDHLLEDHRSFTPDECLRGLLSSYVFAYGAGSGYHASINGGPCCYVLLKGDSLFETLVLNMLSKAECRMGWDMPPIAWRNMRKQIPNEKFASTSVLNGLTWLPRRITLKAPCANHISRIYWQSGNYMDTEGSWIDPHVPYIVTEGNRVPLRSRPGRSAWRDLAAFGCISVHNSCLPAIIQNASALNDKFENGWTRLVVFGLSMDPQKSARKLDTVFEEIVVPYAILSCSDRVERLKSDIKYIEMVATHLEKIIFWFEHENTGLLNQAEPMRIKLPSDSEIEKRGRLCKEAKNLFFSEIYQFLRTKYFSSLSETDVCSQHWDNSIIELATQSANEIAWHIVNAYALRFGNSARELQIQAAAIGKFHDLLNKSAKERLEVS